MYASPPDNRDLDLLSIMGGLWQSLK